MEIVKVVKTEAAKKKERKSEQERRNTKTYTIGLKGKHKGGNKERETGQVQWPE